MPFGVAFFAISCLVQQEHRFELLEQMRADDDGMARPYIRLEGIKTPRALSWAEERALRQDLVEGARSVANGTWWSSKEWRGMSARECAVSAHINDEAR